MIKNVFLPLLLISFGLVQAATAGTGFVEERKWTDSELQTKIDKTPMTSSLSKEAKVKIVSALQKTLSSHQTRRQFQEAIERMKKYRPMIDAKLSSANLPTLLSAVPLMESGYQNIKGPRSAGIWQFIPETARKYGLKVDESADERFEAEKQTDAAVKYYQVLHQKFKDWPTALLAYNVGEAALEQGLKKAGTENVWTALDKGQFNDSKDYLPQLLATSVIINNPELLQ